MLCHTVHWTDFGCHEAVQRVRQCIKAPEVQVPVAQQERSSSSAQQQSYAGSWMSVLAKPAACQMLLRNLSGCFVAQSTGQNSVVMRPLSGCASASNPQKSMSLLHSISMHWAQRLRALQLQPWPRLPPFGHLDSWTLQHQAGSVSSKTPEHEGLFAMALGLGMYY